MINNLFTFVRTLGNQRIEGKKFFTGQVGILGSLSDSSGSLGTAGKVLSTTGSGVQWITVGSSNVQSLNDLSDVIITTPATGQLLRFNGTNWVNWTHSFLDSSSTLGDLFNVGSSADGANDGDILRFNEQSGLWVADEFPSFTEVDTLDSVTGRGATTTNSITVGGVSTSGTVTAAVVTTPLIEREGVLTINSEQQVDQGEPNPNLLYVSWMGDNKFVINADGYAIANTGYKVVGGTASGFLKADGSIDTGTYLTSYTETQTLDDVTDLGATTTNAITVGGVTAPILEYGGLLTIDADSSGSLLPGQGDPAVPVLNFQWAGSTQGYIDTSGKITFSGFKTPTGTSSGFLKANGSVDTNAYITGIDYIDDIGDVNLSSPVAGEILQFDGQEWVNGQLPNFTYASKVQHEVKAGVSITKGQAVYVTSADGTNMIVGLASNASEATSSKTMGLSMQNLAINGHGFVITEGLLDGLNTSTATAGDPVWLGTGGNLIYGLTNKPIAPAHLVFIGIVTRSNANNGEIFVKVQNGFELNEIHDVLISSPSAGQLIRRDSDGLWKNWTPNYLTSLPTHNHDDRYYTESEIIAFFGGETEIAGYNQTNWDTAYGWGNHATAGYLTSFTEADTLATVTTRGNSTTNGISVGSLSVPSYIYLTNGGAPTFISESWGINLNGQGTQPVQVRSASLSVGYTLGGGTNYGTSNLYVAGNVGVGNTAPNQKLELSVGNGVAGGIRINYDSTAVSEGMDITYLNTGSTITSFDSRYISDTAAMRFRMKTYGSSPVTAMTILGSGNIGINRTSPSYKLDVAGNARFDNELYVGGVWSSSYGPRDSNGNINFVDWSSNVIARINRLSGIASVGNRKLSMGILDINSNGSPEVRINTKIPFALGGADFTVNIKGFQYGSANMVSLSIGWHYYLSQFYQETAISNGAFSPNITLAVDESNMVVIHLSNVGYWPKLYVESVYSSNYADDYVANWNWTDAGVDALSNVTPVAYKPLDTSITGNAAYATNAGNSTTTSQTNFSTLTVSNNTVATQAWVTSQGYATSFSETDTLASVTGRGNSTSSNIIVTGGSGTTPSISIQRNIASLSNYWTAVQLEVQATSGIAAMSLHRNGYSHVGIYHDAANQLKFNFNGGEPVLYHNTGTIWGSGNDGAGSGLDADLLDGQHGSYYQPASTAITTSNIGSQSVSYADYTNRTYRGIIEDTRAAQRTPSGYDDYRVSWEFTDQITGIPDWHTVMTMQGWHDGYAAWQIIGPSSTTAHENWYLRSGNTTTWNTLRRIWHNGDFSSTNISNWNAAYNDRITAVAVSGTGTKTLTLTQQDGGTLTTTWTDYDTDNDAQTLSWDQGQTLLSISGGNDITLTGLATEDYVNSQGFVTSSGTVAGVVRTVTGTNSAELVRGNMGDNDQARILVGATASNAGYLEIATADDGTEPIYVRQYTGTFTTEARTATLLDGSGNTTFPGNLTIGGTFTENSSIRFKENIQPLEPALAKVQQLNPVAYTKIASQEEEIGLIAEEVAELFPEVVTYNENGQPQGIQYQRLSVILLKAVQELTERVNKLENK
jgi:hypothetical protein